LLTVAVAERPQAREARLGAAPGTAV
jgi:hypothetical protein